MRWCPAFVLKHRVFGQNRSQMAGSEFPDGFRIQRIRVSAAMAIAEYAPAAIAAHFREHPAVANDLLSESYDKRYSPSTFIAEEGNGFSVGWYSNGYVS